LSLFEVTAATALLGLVVAGALEGVAVARRLGAEHDAAARGVLLAQELLAEVVSQAYADPQTPAGTFGPDAGEAHGARSSLDDVDDYHNFNARSPRDRFGNAMAGFAGWRIFIEVEWVEADDPTEPASSDTGLKRITVTSTSPTGEVASLAALRSAHGSLEEAQPVAHEPLAWLSAELTLRDSTDAQRIAVPLAPAAPQTLP
jgi:hypothetical protein